MIMYDPDAEQQTTSVEKVTRHVFAKAKGTSIYRRQARNAAT